jgi:serine O-acetyltransferase
MPTPRVLPAISSDKPSAALAEARRATLRAMSELQREAHDATKAELPGLWDLIREDFNANERDWTKPGFRALAVYRFGIWRMGIGSKIFRAPMSFIYRSMFRYVRNHYGIELPYTAAVGRRVVIEHQGDIVVHGHSVIGDGCILRQGVTLGNKNLDAPLDAPILGKNVNIGAGAKILGKVTIGDGAQIGANAVVIRPIPAGAVAVGNPARLIERKKPRTVQEVRSV